MKRLVIGDVFACKVPEGYGYVQYVQKKDLTSPYCCDDYIRILPGIYSVQPDLEELVQHRENLTVMFSIGRLYRKGACEYVGNYSLPEKYALQRYGADFNLRCNERKNGRLVGSWAICDYYPDDETRNSVMVPLRFQGTDDISVVPEQYYTTLTNLSPDPYLLFYWIATSASLHRAESMSCSESVLNHFIECMEHRLDVCYK